MDNLLAMSVTTFSGVLIGAFGGYLAGYMKKKGENLATHEDINKLVEQVRAVTTATQEIEAKISDDLWNRQRRWNLKRDVLFEGMRRLSDLQEALADKDAVLQVELSKNHLPGQSWLEIKVEKGNAWSKTGLQFRETLLLIESTCGKDAVESFKEFGKLAALTAAKINKDDGEAYAESFQQLANFRAALLEIVREELKIDSPSQI